MVANFRVRRSLCDLPSDIPYCLRHFESRPLPRLLAAAKPKLCFERYGLLAIFDVKTPVCEKTRITQTIFGVPQPQGPQPTEELAPLVKITSEISFRICLVGCP